MPAMNANPVKYKFYPTLLNAYDSFEKGYVTETELIDRINRLPSVQTEAQAKGSSFEDAAIKGINEELFDAAILARVRALLPRPMVKTQAYCEYQMNDVLLYGYVDVIGKIMAVDIKTTGKYEAGNYAGSHQNFYLPALRSKGIRKLRYVITDFKDVYSEEYDQTFDFSHQLAQISSFCQFVEDNRTKITDGKIFAG